MARALIIACGCRGVELGRDLLAAGWQVRGTTRRSERLAEIEAAGIDARLADPDRIATVVEQLDDVAVIFWLLGSARGGDDEVASLHGPRLERLLEEIVDTPVRGFVYEAAGAVAATHLSRGAAAVEEAGRRWRIPVAVPAADPRRDPEWRRQLVAAAMTLTA